MKASLELYSDSQLIAFLKGDEEKIAQAYYWLRKKTQAFFFTLTKETPMPQQTATDLFTESFMSLKQAIVQDKFLGESSLMTYFLAITRNQWNKQNRGKKLPITIELTPELIDSLPASVQPHDLEAHTTNHTITLQLMQCLREPCKSIIYQFYFLKYSHEKIAKNLGYESAHSVKTQKSRCIKYLFAKYKELKNINP